MKLVWGVVLLACALSLLLSRGSRETRKALVRPFTTPKCASSRHVPLAAVVMSSAIYYYSIV